MNKMNRIIAAFAAFTAGLETAASVYSQLSTHVPQIPVEVPKKKRMVGFVTADVMAEETQPCGQEKIVNVFVVVGGLTLVGCILFVWALKYFSIK